MKKRILMLVLAFAMILPCAILFAACGGGGENKTVISVQCVDSNDNDKGVVEYNYIPGLNVENPLSSVYLKIYYSDSTTEKIALSSFNDSRFNVEYTFNSGADSVIINGLPQSDEYKAGAYTIKYVLKEDSSIFSSFSIIINALNYGMDYSLSIEKDGSLLTTWDYVGIEDNLYDYIKIKNEKGEEVALDFGFETLNYVYFVNLEDWNQLKAELNLTKFDFNLPNTAEVQDKLDEISKELYVPGIEIPVGEYVVILEINEDVENFLTPQFITKGQYVEITKTVLNFTEETKENILKSYDLEYTSPEELQNGIALPDLSITVGGFGNIQIIDKHGNEYNLDDFNSSEWVDSSNVNYQQGGVVRKVYLTPKYLEENFDYSSLLANVMLNVSPITIKSNIEPQGASSKNDYLYNDPSSIYFGIYNEESYGVLHLADGFGFEDLFNLTVTGPDENVVPGASIVRAEKYNVQGTEYYLYKLVIPEEYVKTGTYTVSYSLKEGREAICQVDEGFSYQFDYVINPLNLDLTPNEYNYLIIKPDGTIEILFDVSYHDYQAKDDSVTVNVDATLLSKLSNLSAEDITDLVDDAISNLELSDLQVTVVGNQLKFTAKVVGMGDINNFLYIKIKGNTNDDDFKLDYDFTYGTSVGKYYLQESDYVKNSNEETLRNETINISINEGEYFKFKEYLNLETMTNDYGKWVLQRKTAEGQYENYDLEGEIDGVSEAGEYKLVFNPYSSIAVGGTVNDVPIILKVTQAAE